MGDDIEKMIIHQTECPICRADINYSDIVARCPSCGIVMHVDCANAFDFKCPNRCSSKLIVEPGKTQISVSGTSAEEVKSVASSLLKQIQTALTGTKKNPVSILFLAAEPTETAHLRLGLEIREIQEKIQLSKRREDFSFSQKMAARPVDISQALLDIEPNVVHFSGHGTFNGALCFENETGQIHPINPESLSALFEQFSKHVKCVVLNACYSEIQARAISKQMDYVIGMNKEIGDKAAISFSIGFYQALGAGRTIEDAFKLGCVQIRLQNIPEHLTPVLYKRGDTC